MSISVNNSVVMTSQWSTFKNTAITNKTLSIQYDDDGTVYTIVAFDGPIAYSCTIWKGTVPAGVVTGGYVQTQNDSDKSDFETNYKPTANARVVGIAQNATLGSNLLNMMGGSVTTSAPSYTTGTVGAVSLTTAGAIRIDGSAVTQPISGTVTANAGSGTFTVGGTITSNIGTTGGLALDATVAKLTVAQSTALGSNTQTLIGGSVTASAPSYTTGNINPLSLTTTGALRIDGSGVTQPISGTVTANQGGAPWLENITQFGGVNLSTGTGASGTGIPRVTVSNDSNVLVTQSGSWTVVSNQGTAASLASAWSTKITDATNGPAAVKPASTAAVAGDPALVVAISPNNPISVGGVADVTATGSLGALNAAVPISLAGLQGAGMQLLAGTLIGTIVSEVSLDGGTTWVGTFFKDPVTENKVSSIVFGTANTATTRSVVVTNGASHVRVRVSLYTSGTATCNMRSSQANDPALMYGGAAGSALPPVIAQIGGSDGSNLRAVLTDSSGRQNVIGAAAVGATVAGNPVYVSGKNPSGNVAGFITDSAGAQIIAQGANQFVVQSNATITSGGSQTVINNDFGNQQISLIINITATPTGTTPTIQYNIQELDPGNNTTVMGNFAQTGTLNAIGITTISLTTTNSNAVKINWIVTGASASFTGVYATVVTKTTPGSTFVGGEQRVQQEPSQIFLDAWDLLSLDTTNRWKAATTTGGGTFVYAQGGITVGSGTTANGFAYLESQITFSPTDPGWILVRHNLNIENPVLINAYRFWGIGTNPASPTTSAPLTDAAGFEIGITGKLFAVTFASGTRNAIQDLSSATGNAKQPADAGSHNYYVFFRGDRIFWAIDNYDNVVASTTSGALGPNNNVLPIKLLAIAGATPPTSNATISNNAISLGDTAHNNATISDGTYGFRKATIKAASTAAVATDPALVVAISPNNSITASNPSVSATAASPPASATYVGGSVTTSAPSYTTGQLNALSLTTSGALRVDGSAVTQPISGTLTANIGSTNGLALDATLTGGTQTTKITDGTNTATVKAASTGTNALDTALVVTPSPNALSTYSSVVVGITPASAATDIFFISGSISRTIRVTRIEIDGVQTIAGFVPFQLLFRSVVNSGGTSVNATKVQHITSGPVYTAGVVYYTANPTTLGMSLGAIRAANIFLPTASTTTYSESVVWEFGRHAHTQEIILQSQSQRICVNLNGATISGGKLNIGVEWTEE